MRLTVQKQQINGDQKRCYRNRISCPLPIAKDSRSSQPFTSQSSNDPFPAVIVFPLAFSIRKPRAAASQSALSLHLNFGEPQLLKMPWPLMKIWQTSTTSPPVYRSVQPFLIQSTTAFRYSSFSEAERRLPGLKMLVFSRMVRWSCETIQQSLTAVTSCTLPSMELRQIAVVLGPKMLMTALTWSLSLAPMRLLGSVFQMEKMLPMAKLVSTMELPSSGSKVTTYPSPSPQAWQQGLSSLAKPFTSGLRLRCFSMMSSHCTSWCSCSSPKRLEVSSLTMGEWRRKEEISRQASRMLWITLPSVPATTARLQTRPVFGFSINLKKQ